jgi:hypothetical protein
MLASTVQFSNNDQPPVTTCRSRPLPGPASRRQTKRPCPQTPNSVPDTPRRQDRVPRRSSTNALIIRSVPSSQRSTHEQPASDTR